MPDKNFLNAGLWFKPQSLQPMVNDATWERGLMLYRAKKVVALDIEPVRLHWQLLGEVQGTERLPYEVAIEMALMPDGEVDFWDSDCSCPVGRQCKHGVALMLEAADQGLQLLEESGIASAVSDLLTPPNAQQLEVARAAAAARAQEVAREQAEAQLLRWLQALDNASGQPPAAKGTARERADQFLYLLSVLGPQGPAPQLEMEAVISYTKLTGGWAKPRSIKTAPYSGQPVYDQALDADRQVLQLMRAMPDASRFTYAFSSSATPSGQAGLLGLQQAASTGRLFMDDGHGGPGVPMQWGPPQPLNWHWHEVPGPAGVEASWVLKGKLNHPSAKLCLNHPPLYLDVAHGLVGQATAEGLTPAQLDVLVKSPPLKRSALEKHQVSLIERLGPLPLPPILQALVTLKGITPTACLHISPAPPDKVPFLGLLQARLRFDYNGNKGWWAGQGSSVIVTTPQGRCLLEREGEAELAAITQLFELGLRAREDGLFGIPLEGHQQDWLQWADHGFDVLIEAGFRVTVEDALKGWITHAENIAVKLEPEAEEEETSPWFELSLGMEIGGQRHNILPLLPSLIAAAASSPLDPVTGLPSMPPYVYLPSPVSDGFVRLPTDGLKPWMAALLDLVGDRGHDFNAESLKLSRLDALRTGAALGEGAQWEGAHALNAMVQQLSGREELPHVPPPANLHASLRPYQQQGLNWLQFLSAHGLGGILADDMGLGKTLQTLAHIQIEKNAGRLTHPALIVAPVSLMGNWRKEAERFCPELRCVVLHGKDRHEAASSMDEYDLVIAPYSLLQRDRDRWLEAQWHLVVLDEAQNIKNASTNAAQVVGQLQTKHRLCLSGTPMENHLGEIWSLFHFLMPGFLGSQGRFNELFRHPIERQGDPERLTQLRARITPFMLRRTKALVAKDLPPKVETIMRVELAGQQADLYETIRLGMEKTVREALSSKGLAKSHITILDALLKLRQVCCSPKLLKLDAAQKVKTSAKLEQLMEMLPEMLSEGRKILLFSQFTSMLTLIEVELKQRGIKWVKLTGQSQERDGLIEQFTSGQVPLFLISLKAGGVGLNLPQADTVIHFDPWWNPAAEAQATDRAHRIGQTQSLWVVKLVAQGTIEERILALQERKAALGESIYSGATGRKQPLFTEGDLAELLRPLSD